MARNYCCRCIDNRTAVKTLGIISLVAAALIVLQVVGDMAHHFYSPSGYVHLAAFQALIGWLLYAGVKQDRDGLLLGWLILAGIGIAAMALAAVATLAFVLYITLSGVDLAELYCEYFYCYRVSYMKDEMKDVPGLAAGAVVVLFLLLAIQTWIFLLVKSVRRDIIEKRQMYEYVHLEKN